MKRVTPKIPFDWSIIIYPLIVFGGLGYYFRPWIHGFVMGLVRSPFLFQALLIWGLAYWFYFRKKANSFDVYTSEGKKTINFNFGSLGLLLTLLFVAPMFSALMPELHLSQEINFQTIDTLPETKENLRLMPYEVANRYSKDSLQLSQYRLGTENIANIDGKLSWTFPLIPDGGVLSFMIKNKGIIVVDATSQEKNTNPVWKDLQVGEGMQVFDNLWWNLFKTEYLVDVDDPFYIPYEDTVYTAVSLTRYTYEHFYGLLYAVPRFGGVALVDAEGNIEILSPEQAKEHPVLQDNRLFPEYLARLHAHSYVYKKGLINKWFIHEDQIDIRDVPGTSSARNYQPYLMDTEDGLKWFVSAEPYGESRGIFKIFLIDAIDGSMQMLELPVDESLTGPIKARDFVRRENPVVDWNRFAVIEPLPFIKDDELYWKVVIAPSDAAGIAYQAFVNAKTNKVTQFESEEDVAAFILGTQPEAEESFDLDEEVQEIGREQLVSEIQKRMDEIDVLLERLKE